MYKLFSSLVSFFVLIISCNEQKNDAISYLEISNKSQIDSITQTFIEKFILLFIPD